MRLYPKIKWMWGFCVDRLCKRVYVFPLPCLGLVIEIGKAPPIDEVEDFAKQLDGLKRSFCKLAADSEELGMIRATLEVNFQPGNRFGVDVEKDNTSRMFVHAFQGLVQKIEQRRVSPPIDNPGVPLSATGSS